MAVYFILKQFKAICYFLTFLPRELEEFNLYDNETFVEIIENLNIYFPHIQISSPMHRTVVGGGVLRCHIQ